MVFSPLASSWINSGVGGIFSCLALFCYTLLFARSSTVGLQFQFWQVRKAAVHVAVRPSVLDTVKPDNNNKLSACSYKTAIYLVMLHHVGYITNISPPNMVIYGELDNNWVMAVACSSPMLCWQCWGVGIAVLDCLRWVILHSSITSHIIDGLMTLSWSL